MPMRLLPILIVLLTICRTSFAQPESVDLPRNSAETQTQADRDEARWAELEAQRRAADGDYDGAVQAHQQAEQALQDVRRQQMLEQNGR
jgi:hypothetical protein